jgi:hypothetical protein
MTGNMEGYNVLHKNSVIYIVPHWLVPAKLFGCEELIENDVLLECSCLQMTL